jgi:hypothetical protein
LELRTLENFRKFITNELNELTVCDLPLLFDDVVVAVVAVVVVVRVAVVVVVVRVVLALIDVVEDKVEVMVGELTENDTNA